MKTIWKRIEKWLQEHAPEIDVRLLPGIEDDEIVSFEKKNKVDLPADFKESAKIHNGQHGLATPLIGSWRLLSLDDIVRDIKLMNKINAREKLDETEAVAVGPVKAVWWSSKWISIASNGAGDLICLDLTPETGGNVGQLVLFLHMSEKREVLASSFHEYLEKFADDLENKKYRVSNNMLTSERL